MNEYMSYAIEEADRDEHFRGRSRLDSSIGVSFFTIPSNDQTRILSTRSGNFGMVEADIDTE